MRDLAIIAFMLAFVAIGLKRPFVLVLAYAYVDIVSPQRLSYYLLNSVPVSQIMALLAIGGWLLLERGKQVTFTARQGLMLLLIAYCYFTTVNADFPIEAAEKWAWAWKSVFWAVFLAMTLHTKLRIEAHLLVMVLGAASIIITGAIKTLVSGGGYGQLTFFVDNNSNLYESSQISTVAIAIIPIILWFARFGTIFPPDRRTQLFSYSLVFACVLIPIGTEARTGLICIAVLAMIMVREVKRRLLYVALIGFATAAAIPMLPQSFTERMGTIKTYQGDQSAGTRIAVWVWTLEYVKDNPLGGGFDAFRQNRIAVPVIENQDLGSVEVVRPLVVFDEARAPHSSYFEMLGEQGFPGLFLFLLIHAIGLLRMEVIRRRYRREEGRLAWVSSLATSLQSAQIIYLVGSIFVGMAFQPFIYMLLGVQIGLDTFLSRTARKEAKGTGWAKKPAAAAPA